MIDNVLDEDSDAESDALATAFEGAENQAHAGAGESEPLQQDDGDLVEGEEQTREAPVVASAVKIEGHHAVPKTEANSKRNTDIAGDGPGNSNASSTHNNEVVANPQSFPDGLLSSGPFGQQPGQPRNDEASYDVLVLGGLLHWSA